MHCALQAVVLIHSSKHAHAITSVAHYSEVQEHLYDTSAILFVTCATWSLFRYVQGSGGYVVILIR